MTMTTEDLGYKIRRFRKESHAAIVGGWLLDRDLPEQLKFDLPKLGWVVSYQNDHPIAAGFIRKMENCSVGLVDSYITNPAMPAVTRNDALQLLTARMIKDAARLGFEKLIANSTDRHVLERAVKHGFEVLPNIMLQKRIDQEKRENGL